MTVCEGLDALPSAEYLDTCCPVEKPGLVDHLASASDLYDSIISGTATGVYATEILQMFVVAAYLGGRMGLVLGCPSDDGTHIAIV